MPSEPASNGDVDRYLRVVFVRNLLQKLAPSQPGAPASASVVTSARGLQKNELFSFVDDANPELEGPPHFQYVGTSGTEVILKVISSQQEMR